MMNTIKKSLLFTAILPLLGFEGFAQEFEKTVITLVCHTEKIQQGQEAQWCRLIDTSGRTSDGFGNEPGDPKNFVSLVTPVGLVIWRGRAFKPNQIGGEVNIRKIYKASQLDNEDVLAEREWTDRFFPGKVVAFTGKKYVNKVFKYTIEFDVTRPDGTTESFKIDPRLRMMAIQ